MWCSNPGGGHCVCVNSVCSYGSEWFTVWCSNPGGGHGGCCVGVGVNSACSYGVLCGVLTQVEVVVFV